MAIIKDISSSKFCFKLNKRNSTGTKNKTDGSNNKHITGCRKLFLQQKTFSGSVLIEFSFAIPVLVIILYFSMDVPLAYRVSAKLQKTSELYTQMLLNASKNHDPNVITINDLENISRSVGLTFTGIIGNSRYPFNLSTYVICANGIGNNEFEIKWCIHIQNNLEKGEISSYANEYKYSIINGAAKKTAGNVEKLTILKDEKKLLIETVAWYTVSDNARGFNRVFYLLTIPGKEKSGAKTFGDKTAITTIDEDLAIEPIQTQ